MSGACFAPWCADERAKELGLTNIPTTFYFCLDVLHDSPMPHEAMCFQIIAALEAKNARLAPVVEAAQNLVRHERDHSFAIMATGVATQINALLDALCAAVDALEDLAGPSQEQ